LVAERGQLNLVEWLVTPDELNTYARQQYNAANDSFFADSELYKHQWFAQQVLAKEAKLIESTYTTPTVASQQEYTWPDAVIAIKRITWNGKALDRITFREDDILTGRNASTSATGEPRGYALFDRVIYLRPVPASVYTLKLFTFDQPQEVSSTSVIDVPEEFHLDLVNYLLWQMAAKDQNFEAARYYREQWTAAVERAKRWSRKRLTADGFNVVRDDEAFYSAWEIF
jgi:hypothetical protein